MQASLEGPEGPQSIISRIRSRLQRKGPEAVPFSFIAISQSGAARRMPRVRAVVKKQNPDAALHRRNCAGNVGLTRPPGRCQLLPNPRVLGVAQARQRFAITRRGIREAAVRKDQDLPAAFSAPRTDREGRRGRRSQGQSPGAQIVVIGPWGALGIFPTPKSFAFQSGGGISV